MCVIFDTQTNDTKGLYDSTNNSVFAYDPTAPDANGDGYVYVGSVDFDTAEDVLPAAIAVLQSYIPSVAWPPIGGPPVRAGFDIKKILIYGGLAVGAWLIFNNLGGGGGGHKPGRR